MRSTLNDIAFVATLLLLLVLSPPRLAQAQIGLGDVGAATTIGQELESGTTGRNRNRGANGPSAEESDGSQAAAEEGAEAAPKRSAVSRDKWNDRHSILRQKTPSAAWPKLLIVALIFLIWVRSVDWINRDAQVFSLGHEKWNMIAAFPFLAGMLGLLLIPNFIAGASVLALTWLVPFVIYTVHHNSKVEPHQKVFTGGWFRYQIALAGKKVGLDIGSEKKAGYMKGPPVDIEAHGGDERINKANLLTARQSPGYVHAKELVADMVDLGASRVMLDYGPEAVATRRLIDGVWHNGDPRDRESGDVMLAVIKQLCNLNAGERQKKQDGVFGAKYEGKQYVVVVTSQGTKSGERVAVSLRGGKQRDYKTFEELGMREKLREQWLNVMLSERGVVVYGAMPEGGLTTLTDVGLLETDRLVRDFFAIEDVEDPQRDIENIEVFKFDRSKGESPAQLVPALSRKYPNVYVCRDFVDAASAKALIEEVEEDRLIITTTHAKEAPEALLRILQKKAPHKEFTKAVTAVLCTRLIRLLCESCKVSYEPTPDLLKKLGIPAGKVTELYRTPKPEEIDKPCKACHGIGFQGRTGLFELLIVDDQVRQVMLKQPKLDILRKASRAAGMRTMQEEGVLLIAKGVTSLPELSRVLKS